MNESLVNDRFNTDFNRIFGFGQMAFKLDGNKEPPKHIPEWRINRTNARSAGKAMYLHTKPSKCCGSLVRRVYNNECFDCYQLEKKNAKF